MNNHLTPYQISCYQGRLLAPGNRIQIDQHIAVCDVCREQVFKAGDIDADVKAFFADLEIEALEEDDHLECEQMVAYVSDKLDEIDRIIVASHLESCAICASEVRELQQFTNHFNLVTLSTTFRERASIRIKQVFLWRMWRPFKFGYAAGLATALIIMVIASFALWREREPLHKAHSRAVPDSASSPETPPLLTAASSPSVIATESRIQQGNSTARGNPVVPRTERKSPNKRLVAGKKSQSTASALTEQQSATGIATSDFSGIKDLPSDLRRSLVAALTTGEMDGADKIKPIARRTEVTLQGGVEKPRFDVVSPVGTYVLTNPVTFKWQPYPSATTYVVTIADADYNIIDISSPLSGTQYICTKKLQVGITYNWEVTTIVDGERITAPNQTSGMAKFKLLAPERAAFVQQMQRKLDGSHLALGVLYGREGLIEDAEREIKRAVTESPRSEVARRLLQRIQSIRYRK